MDREALLREAAEDSLLREAARRRFIYKDVEELITGGFLHQTVQIEDSYVVFRTLGPEAEKNFLLRAFGDEANWKRHHVAASVYMVNGLVIDPREPNAPYYIFKEWLENTRWEHLEVFHPYILGLRNRIHRATRITHAFCNETYSRHLWKNLGRPEEVQNVVQRLWAAYNHADDVFDDDLRQWQHTRSIVGSMTNKGAKQLRKSADQWEEKRKTRQQKAIEDAINWVISGEREDQKPITVTVNGQEFTVPKVHASQTVEEMQEELMRAVRGEKDYHDHMVEQYKEFHRARLEKARQERQAALQKAREQVETRGISGRTTIVGYTPEQLAQINPEVLRQPTARVQTSSPEHDRFDKYVKTDVEVGWIGTSGRPEAADPVEEGTPKKESLQDKISRRNPRLKS